MKIVLMRVARSAVTALVDAIAAEVAGRILHSGTVAQLAISC